jgi:hypothetical protein
MSSFFGDLYGNVRAPDVVMNQGPLPSAGGLPGGFAPDAQINYGSTLLGDVKPYSYGEPAHLSDQTAYYAIPHKIQKIIPGLRLPDARDPEGTFMLAHGVDDGDVAFSLHLNRSAGTIDRMHAFERLELGRAVDPFVNLATVNFLLAGIQRFWNRPERSRWQQLMVDLDFSVPATSAKADFSVQDAIRFVSEVARPFGVVHGVQGGQHEGSLAAATYPVSAIATLAVGGRIENLVNMWREHAISAGDDLTFRLEYLPIAARDGSIEFVLNHWRKGVVRQRFEHEALGDYAWQLVPAIHSLHPPAEMHEGYDHREHGYWHVARSQVMKPPDGSKRCHQDDSCFLRGSLIEATFEPVFVRLSVLCPPPPPVWFARKDSKPPQDPTVPPPPAPSKPKKRKVGGPPAGAGAVQV